MTFDGEHFDAAVCISVLEHVEDDAAFLRHVLGLARRAACFTVDFSPDGLPHSPHHLRTYSPARLAALADAAAPTWALHSPPDWAERGAHVYDYNFASLTLIRARYDVTFASILRDAERHLDRYAGQMRDALGDVAAARIVWVEGGSLDRTWERLQALAREFEAEGHQVVLLKDADAGHPHYSSVDLDVRWRHLEAVWNQALDAVREVPSNLAVLVENDLIWDRETLSACIQHLRDSVADNDAG